MNDEIIAEIRKYRKEHATSFNYDIKKNYADLKAKELKNPHKKVTLAPKRLLKPTGPD